MQSPTRVLFVTSEASPFTDATEIGDLARALPERLQESGRYELRIMMPRYGVISERRNRLHEVIRLSGAEIEAGETRETLKVKVASIPGIRLQIYFMENARFFKRKGMFSGRGGETWDDNADRALFFGRAALQTIRNLGWSPELVHAIGWTSAFVPYLIRTDFAGDALLGSAKVAYTPDGFDAQAALPAEYGPGMTLRSLAELHADALLFPPSGPDEPRLTADPAALVADTGARYDAILGREVPV